METKRFTVEDGSLFVLYTDGLVESRDRDITEGLDRLQNAFGPGSPEADLEDLCKTSLDGVYGDAQRDDIAVLIAKLRRIPEENRHCWTLEPEFSSVRMARSMIRDPLKRWGLEDLIPVTELLVSELVTNAIKYAKGEILMRLILESGSLACEVHDSSPALPRVLQVDRDAENGRGLHVVSQLATRWGARRTHTGKVVWCEQTLSETVIAALSAADEVAAEIDEPVPVPVSLTRDTTGPFRKRIFLIPNGPSAGGTGGRPPGLAESSPLTPRSRSWRGCAACRCRGPAWRRRGRRGSAAGRSAGSARAPVRPAARGWWRRPAPQGCRCSSAR